MRRQREEFREKLVALIIGNEEKEATDEFPNIEERELLRYYYYIKHGIDTIHVAPLSNKILTR